MAHQAQLMNRHCKRRAEICGCAAGWPVATCLKMKLVRVARKGYKMVVALAFSSKIEFKTWKATHEWHDSTLTREEANPIKGRTHPADHKSSSTCHTNCVLQVPWNFVVMLFSLLLNDKHFCLLDLFALCKVFLLVIKNCYVSLLFLVILFCLQSW